MLVKCAVSKEAERLTGNLEKGKIILKLNDIVHS